MILQIIYTLENGQMLANFDFSPEIIKTEESFIKFCLDALTTKSSFTDSIIFSGNNLRKNKVPKVVKLSGCIYLEEGTDVDTPEWWNKANGKVYFDN